MPVVSLASLLIQETEAVILQAALDLASSIGINVTSWLPGDPTRSLFIFEATKLSALETIVVGFVGSGFLDFATGDWLTILAQEVFNVTRPEATFATADCLLTNTGGAIFDIAAGDLTAKNTDTGATYHNTTGGTLVSSGTLTLTFEADIAGSGGNASVGEIDDLVTTLLGVTISNALSAVGIDAQDDPTLRQQCRDKLGSLSPNGPADAYSYVARTPALTGVTDVTRVRTFPDSSTGDVLVYIAGPSGGVSGGDVTAVTNAIALNALPLAITPTVLSANNVPVSVTSTVWVYRSVNKTTAQVQADVNTALTNLFLAQPIGGNIIPPATSGSLYQSSILAAIEDVYPQIFRVSLASPTGDTPLGNGDVPVLGSVSTTVVFIDDPK